MYKDEPENESWLRPVDGDGEELPLMLQCKLQR